jgi:diguanylate cyclase (GGDEF)-like protein
MSVTETDTHSFTLVVQRPELQCTFASPGGLQVLDLDEAAVVGHPVLELVHPEDRTRLRGALATLSRNHRSEALRVRLLTRAGQAEWFEVQLHARGRGLHEVVLLAEDDTQRDVTPVRDVLAGHVDELTGAVTRPVLLDHAEQALRRLAREQLWVALLFLDLDRLKHVNDTMGHAAGDRVLRELVSRVSGLLRPADTLARLGGDEFAVLVGDLHDPEDAYQLARRIVSVSHDQFVVDGVPVDCSVSVGLTTTADASQDMQALLRQADVAMYQAKSAGRGRWRAWGVQDELRLNERRRIESAVRHAVASHTVVLDYLPVVRLADEEHVADEALLRIHPAGEEVLRPPDFLEVATARRLIGSLDLEVLRQALADRATQATPLPVELNLAAADIESDTWCDTARELLSSADGGFAALHVELREDVLRELSSTALHRLAELRESGVRVGLDSFGSDLSALSTLWSTPLDYVKLHPSLTAQLLSVRGARALLRAVCEITHGLDMLVVVNGIENQSQRAAALAAGCDLAQGFLWSGSSPSWQATVSPNGQGPA